MITAKQKQVFDFIQQRVESDGAAPSYREIAERFGHASRGNSYVIVGQLVLRGFVRRNNGAIEIVRRDRPAQLFKFNDTTKHLEPWG